MNYIFSSQGLSLSIFHIGFLSRAFRYYKVDGLSDGLVSLYVSQPVFFIRPKVVANVSVTGWCFELAVLHNVV
jgi:hypothetical protein